MPTFRERLHLLLDEAQDKDHTVKRKNFADMLGTTINKVSPWLDGNGRPDFETLKIIAKNANVSVSWLIGETDAREIPILPKSNNDLPEQAQKEYHFVMDYLKFKYGMRPHDP